MLGALDDVVPNRTRFPCVGGFRSFSGDTGVLMAGGTLTPIADVKVGDWVLAADPETGERGARQVTHLWIHEDTLVDLVVETSTVTTTEDHPFWNHTDQQWQDAQNLDIGDQLLTADGELLTVNGLDHASAYIGTAYNLTVNDIHTYYVQVGDTETLVHNCGEQLELIDGSGFFSRVPPKETLLKQYADLHRQEARFVSEYTSPSGATYRDWNRDRPELPANHPLLVTGDHTGCSEFGCLLQAFNTEGPNAVHGGSISTLQVRGVGSTIPPGPPRGHGSPVHPCTANCQPLLSRLNVNWR